MSFYNVEKWSSLEETAEHLGVSKDTIYRWISDKHMPATKIGRQWKFKLSEVDSWVKSGNISYNNNKGEFRK